MSRLITRTKWTRQPQVSVRVDPTIRADFAWTAANPRNVIAGPKVSSSTASLKSTTGGLQIGNGYTALSGASLPSLFSTTWTEIGAIYLDGTNQVVTLSGRGVSGGGQSVIFSPGASNVDFVCWAVNDVFISGGALPTGLVYYVAKRSGNAHSLWLNGRLYGTASSASSVAASDGAAIAIGADAGSGGNQGGRALSSTSGIGLLVRTPIALTDTWCVDLSRNPWQLFTPLSRTIGASSAGGVVYPSSDITTTDWFATPGPSFFGMLDEVGAPDDADFVTSPTLAAATPLVMGLSSPLAAGDWDVNVRARRTGNSGQVRVLLLDGGGATVGTSAWQTLVDANGDYVCAVTTTGTAARVRIEVQ